MIAKSLHRILFISMIVIGVIWLAVPFIMAILWSLVDPAEPWTVDRVTPPVMSFYRWTYMWESSNLKYALFNSYLLAPTVSIVTLIFSISTAYVFGRYNFVGDELADSRDNAAYTRLRHDVARVRKMKKKNITANR